MRETRALLPRERLAPDTKRTFMIHKLIKRVKECLIMDMKYSLQEIYPRLFFLWVIIILLKFKCWDEALLELIED